MSSSSSDWIKSVLTGTAPWVDFSIKCPSNLLRGAGLEALGILLLTLAAMTLPEGSIDALDGNRRFFTFALLRVAMLPLILYTYLTLASDHSISFGAALRDFWISVIAFSRMLIALDICLSSCLDKTDHERAPRWIVPKSQAWRFPRAEPLPIPATFAKKMDEVQAPNGKANTVMTPRAQLLQLAKIEAEWYAVPHTEPLFSWRRAMWAVDHVWSFRAGTSWILSQEQRGMEWAHKTFVKAAQYPETSVFGLPEHDGPLWPWLKFLYFIVMTTQTSLLVFEPPTTFYDLPYWHQVYFIVFEASVLICVPPLLEFYVLPWMLKRKTLPPTAIPRLMNDPTAASGTTDFWGVRWHKMIRRKICRAAMLLPFGRSHIGNKLWAFVVSGALHSFVLVRFFPQAPTPWHALFIALSPGPVAFFTAQGLSAAFELILLGPPPPRAGQEPVIKCLVRWAILYGGGIFFGRWFSATLADRGLHTWQAQKSMVPDGMWESVEACRGS